MDFRIYKSLNGFAFRHDGWEDAAKTLEHWAPIIFVVLLAGLFLARGKWRSVGARRRRGGGRAERRPGARAGEADR